MQCVTALTSNIVSFVLHKNAATSVSKLFKVGHFCQLIGIEVGTVYCPNVPQLFTNVS